jgi:hypothetical protein
MATYGKWIMKSARIGASLGGVAGFFYAAYIMATSPALGWTDVLDTMESVVVVIVCALIIGSLCIGIGGLAGLVLGIVASPLSSLTEKRASEANGLNPASWVVNLRCSLLSLLRIHDPDCDCNARKACGDEIRKRLDELSGRTQPRSLNRGDHGEVVGGFDSEPGEVISPPISLAQQQKKIA